MKKLLVLICLMIVGCESDDRLIDNNKNFNESNTDTIYITNNIIDTVWSLRVDTVYVDTIKYVAIDIMEMALEFARQQWTGSSYFSPNVGLSKFELLVNNSNYNDLSFQVRGKLHVTQTQDSKGEGWHYFKCILKHYGSGSYDEIDNWILIDIDIWKNL